MNAYDIAATRRTVEGLWPRTASGRYAWTDMEWSLFVETCAGLNIEHAQAEAALRNYKASTDKYPQVGGLVRAMKGAIPQTAARGVSPRTEQPYPSVAAYRAQLRCHNVTLPEDASRADVVLAWWRQTIEFVMAFRGDVPPAYRDDFSADCIGMAGMSDRETSEQWDALMEFAATVPQCQKRTRVFDRMRGLTRRAVAEAPAEVPA